MARKRRIDVKSILTDPDLRRKLMVSTVQTTQAREGIETTIEQADKAYYVVTEGERAVFFDLSKYQGGKGEPDRRHEKFVSALRKEFDLVRFDVARRDFSSITGFPLAYARVKIVAHLFREWPALGLVVEAIEQGVASVNMLRYVRCWWEISLNRIAQTTTERSSDRPWARFAKGGDFSRFYADIFLVMFVERDWQTMRAEIIAKYPYLKGNPSLVIHPENHYFQPGLTWPLAASVLNVRILPEGCVFGHKGPTIFPVKMSDTWTLLGILNSDLALYLGKALTSREKMGGRWEVGVVKRFPIPIIPQQKSNLIESIARDIHDRKASWDSYNEISTHFRKPWILRDDGIGISGGIRATLEGLQAMEESENAHIQRLYRDLNREVYRLYGIPDDALEIIEETLGDRPPEIIWPQMEGKTSEQKRMEHVWRLLSYILKRIVEADEDGIVPLVAVSAEPAFMDRVYRELEVSSPSQPLSQVEVEIANELKRKVKGYRAASSIREWMEEIYFQYHVSLYKNRPIYWHIASRQGKGSPAFSAFVHYHRFDKNGIAKLRGSYLREAIDGFRREAALAAKEGREEDRVEWQARLEEATELDRKLQLIQEGDPDYSILTPWKSPEERPKGWDPDIDDGVKVNIEPLQKAGVLRIAKVI